MGIGLGLAKAFLAQGAAVAVCGRSREALDLFSHTYPDALAVQADVTQAADRTRLLDRVAERFGHLDVLVNNAGRFVERDFTTGTDPAADLEQEVALNLTAPIQLTSEVLVRWPALTALVFVTSGFALVSPTRADLRGGESGAARLRRGVAPAAGAQGHACA
ncbi:SDR family NAD(P)-dependent oxidoreductase [Hymenobacter cellulosilyticus]|uniref:SDR family NAD(P)-dependent oxidoreductase n=1 Tax=Hymenobacter cellulosilyticus TaxID=2932248 RepID=UPI0035CBFBB8